MPTPQPTKAELREQVKAALTKLQRASDALRAGHAAAIDIGTLVAILRQSVSAFL